MHYHNSSNNKGVKNLQSLAGSIAHETRNPLSAIKGCCEVVRDSLTQAMEFINLISASSSRGLFVIDVILQNMKDGEITKDNFVDLSMADVVKSAVSEYVFESEKEKNLVNFDLVLNLKNDFIFKGDETLMIFVLLNLISNSLYYKAKIDIWLENDDHFSYLYFKDYGVGIAKDKLPYVFDDFFTHDKKEGTGLGLPFCKRVMNAFDGKITCQSVKGQWTEFCLKFPN